MTTVKIAVSIPESVLRGARKAVKQGRASSMSAYVSSALAEQVKRDSLDELLMELLAETGGPLTRQEQAKADRSLFGGKSPRRRRR